MSGLSVVLRKRLPGFDLDVGWSVGGGFTVMFGYSGAGKSLTLAMIAGTVRPDQGRVTLSDRVLTDSRRGIWVPPQRRGMAYLPQGAQLFPHLSVRGNVEFALARTVPRALRRDRALEILARLGVDELAEKSPHQISGGQRQRCALARALACEPAALLLDEPLSALDLPVRVEMRELLRAVQRESGVPFVMVTHDLTEAVSLAETLVVYSGTGAVQVGSPCELIGDPATPEIRRLLRAVELPHGFATRPDAGAVITLDRREHVA